MMSKVSTIVNHTWLAQQIAKGAKNITILDVTHPLPRSPQKPLKEYKQKHIPGAIFFDIDGCGPRHSPYAHTLGPTENFEKYVGSLGITNNTHVVLYDNLESVGVFSAPRAWWMFRIFGHKDVSILEGGLKTWIAEGHEFTDEIPKVEPVKYTATFNSDLIVYYDEMVTNVKEQNFQVMDARGTGRFEGKVPEPRPGVDPGHILHSINVPFPNIFQKESRAFKSAEDMKKMFEEKGLDLSKPVTATCGSGVSACCLAFGAYVAGKEDVRIFDGSWEEFFTKNKFKAPELMFSSKPQVNK